MCYSMAKELSYYPGTGKFGGKIKVVGPKRDWCFREHKEVKVEVNAPEIRGFGVVSDTARIYNNAKDADRILNLANCVGEKVAARVDNLVEEFNEAHDILLKDVVRFRQSPYHDSYDELYYAQDQLVTRIIQRSTYGALFSALDNRKQTQS